MKERKEGEEENRGKEINEENIKEKGSRKSKGK
jgi:hypothetical protein